MEITRTAVLNDLHLKWGDPRAIDLALNVLSDIGVQRLVFNGDVVDFAGFSSHSKNLHPDINASLEDELNSCLSFLDRIEKNFPEADKIFNAGNHEFRMERFVVDKVPGLLSYLRFENFMNFNGRGWEYHPYQEEYQLENTNMYIVHSPPSYGKNGAMTSLENKIDASYMFGCTHRVGYACKTGKHDLYEVFYNGWLGSTDLTNEHKLVFKYTKGHHNWQQCFSVITVIDGINYYVNQCVIKTKKDGKKWCVFDGHYYEN